MTEHFDVAVVGSGIVGLGAAYAAVRRGLRVVVIERSTEPVGATVRNFGHLCFTPQSGDALRYGIASRELWLRLASDAGFWLREAGTHVIARHADELALLAAFGERTGGNFGDEPAIRLLDTAETAAAVPVSSSQLVGGAVLPYDLQTDPRSAATAIRRYLGTMLATSILAGVASSLWSWMIRLELCLGYRRSIDRGAAGHGNRDDLRPVRS